jgi:4-aminobutyrate aminotransferase-like enzyme
VELVRNRESKEPATAEATAICERMREEGVIMYPNGIYSNCLKVKPPMVFDTHNVDSVISILDRVLKEFA